MSQAPQGGGVDISTLSVQQLSALQTRLSQELEHLSASYQRLRAAQSRFRDCIKSIQDGVQGKSGGEFDFQVHVLRPAHATYDVLAPKGDKTPLLIPLTTSLYVPGTLALPSPSSSTTTPKSAGSATLLVDIGTGFFVEKTPLDATKFYTGKIDDLTKNLGDIEKVVGGKSENLRIVEDVLRRKMVEEQPGQYGAGGGGGQVKAAAG
ncbi:subunit of tubulin prefoldin [Cladophialophora chaetospira]|uniref:Subunit of tubulin prefoldin n=1 Tax=Cladophialophora chaetospira TaxID=386627 RepID=A0AA39CLU7_9EURO|nr:subunit of tubulin prefoldin [Cladophialophora chaetospira]